MRRSTSLMLRLALVALCGLAGIWIPAALADDRSYTDRLEHAGNPMDIRSVRTGHAARGRLVHTVKLAKALPKDRLAQLCFNVYLERPFDIPNYTHCVNTPVNRGETEPAKLTIRGSRLSFRFSRRSIENPSRYWWDVETTYSPTLGAGRQCPERGGDCVSDRYPDRSGAVVLHRLRR